MWHVFPVRRSTTHGGHPHLLYSSPSSYTGPALPLQGSTRTLSGPVMECDRLKVLLLCAGHVVFSRN